MFVRFFLFYNIRKRYIYIYIYLLSVLGGKV